MPPGLVGKPQGQWAKTDAAIRNLVAEFAAHRARGGPGEFRPSNTTLQFTQGRVVVDIVAEGDPQALIDELNGLGMRNASHYGQIISGQLPIGQIARAVELQGLQAMSAARKPLTNSSHIGAGNVISEGVQAMYADAVQEGTVSGVPSLNGAGITIGVLSDSFNQQGGYAVGELPAGINVLDDTADCGSACSDEGRGMMELAFDVAPGANFAFHTAFGGTADFANGIEELAAAGADIIVDDVIYFAEPMYQDGIIAQAADTVFGQGVPYFSSAGNFWLRSYEADYVESNEPFYVNTDYAGELHDFDPDPNVVDWHQDIEVPSYSSHRILTLVLQWDQPFASLSSGTTGAEVDLDIFITSTPGVDENGNELESTLYASSRDNNAQMNGGTGEPIELLQFQVGGCDGFAQLLGYGCVPAGTHRLLIAYYDGGTGATPGATQIVPTRMKYVLFDHDISFLEHATDSSTVFGHANAAGAEAIGAAFWMATPAWNCDDPPTGDTYDDCERNVMNEVVPKLEWFSARGGTPVLFDGQGNRIDGAEPRLKPEVVGPDGANTSFFIRDIPEDDPDTNPNFFGTSAAAPHVAAVAALMLEADPNLTPTEVYDFLEQTALNMNPRGGQDAAGEVFDFDTGWGFVQADLAVAAVAGGGTFNARPDVAISSPGDGTLVHEGDSVSFAATATDTEDGDLTADLVWTSSIDNQIGTGGSFSKSDLSPGIHTITASATDSGGRTGTDTVTLTVNARPVVAISAPSNDATFTEGTSIGFQGSASDDEDGDVSASLVWTSDLVTGNIGTGGSFSYQLPLGTHTITATATDTDAATGVASITVNVVEDGSTPADVGALTSETRSLPRNRWEARVSILVLDGNNDPVQGAQVTGDWTGGASATSDCSPITGSDGWCTVVLSELKSNVVSVTFTVTDITGNNITYDPTLLSESDSITVSQSGTSSNTPPEVSITSPADNATFASGAAITFEGSASDAEDGTLTSSLIWTSDNGNQIGTGGNFDASLSDGSYTITAAVTDGDGAEGSASISITVGDTSDPGDPPADISLSATPVKIRGEQFIDLAWNPDGTSAQVDIVRDGAVVETVDNTSPHTHATGNKGGGTYVVQVCEAGTSTCSNEVTVTF